MDIQSALTSLNFTEREAVLYTALLELGTATPLQLARKTGFKRPTVYLDLESLKRKKFVHITFAGKKQMYAPSSPSKLRDIVVEQERAVEQVLPLLQSLTAGSGVKPEIRYYEGLREVERVWFQETFNARESRYISNVQKLEQFSPNVLKVFDERHAQRKIRTREIVMNTPYDRQYAKKFHVEQRQIRIMPQKLQFEFDVALWDKTVSLVSYVDRSVLVMTGNAISTSFRSLFEMAWLASMPSK